MSAQLCILSKAPTPGQCKTRLIQSQGNRGAANLHRLMATRTVKLCSQFANRYNLPTPHLYTTPANTHPFFKHCLRHYRVSLMTQDKGDLGNRMHQALTQSLKIHPISILVGTDCPVLSLEYLYQALSTLQSGADCVLGPSEDGGYVLVGVRRSDLPIFSRMPWGTSSILKKTCQKLEQAHISYHILPTLWDVDVPKDVIRLYRSNSSLRAWKISPSKQN